MEFRAQSMSTYEITYETNILMDTNILTYILLPSWVWGDSEVEGEGEGTMKWTEVSKINLVYVHMCFVERVVKIIACKTMYHRLPLAE